MPNDTVKISFNLSGSEAADRALLEKGRLIDAISEKAGVASVKLGGINIPLSSLNVTQLQSIASQLGIITTSATQAGAVLSRSFNVQPILEAGRALTEQSLLLKRIKDDALALGAAIPNAQMKEFSEMSMSELRGVSAQFRQAVIEARALRAELAQVGQNPIIPGRGQAPLGGQFNVQGSRIQNSQQQQAINSLFGGDQSVVNQSFASRYEAAGRVAAGGLGIATESAKKYETQLRILEKAHEQGAEIGTRAYDKIARSTDTAIKRGNTFSGTTYVGTQILRTFGVEGSRAIEVVGRQFLDFGLTFKDLWASNVFKFTAVIAAGIAVGEITQMITGNILKMNQSALQSAENLVRITRAGLTGTVGEVESDLKKLEDLQKNSEFFSGRGDSDRAAGLRGRALGGRGTDEEISKARKELQTAGSKNVGFWAEYFSLGYAGLADIAEKRAALRKVEGGQISPEMLAKRIQEASSVTLEFEKNLVGTGKKNIFDDANESVKRLQQSLSREARGIAKETGDPDLIKQITDQFSPSGLAKERDDFMESLTKKQTFHRQYVERFVTGSFTAPEGFPGAGKSLSTTSTRYADDVTERFLTPTEIKERTEQFNQDLKKRKEWLDSLKSLNQDISSEFSRENKKLDEMDNARKAMAQLKIELADNPMEKAFDQAIKKAIEFQKTFKDSTDAEKKQAKELGDAIVQQIVFRGGIDFTQKAGSLQADMYRLQEGLGGSDKREKAKADLREEIELRKKLFESRNGPQTFGTAFEATARRGLPDVPAGYRLSTDASYFIKDKDTKADIERKIHERELVTLQSKLVEAGNLPESIRAQNQIFVLDKLLDATSKIGDLTEEEVALRQKTLNQRLALGDAEKHRVLIEIKNSAANVETSVDEELGPNSGSAQSNFVPMSGGATSPFTGTFDPLGGGF